MSHSASGPRLSSAERECHHRVPLGAEGRMEREGACLALTLVPAPSEPSHATDGVVTISAYLGSGTWPLTSRLSESSRNNTGFSTFPNGGERAAFGVTDITVHISGVRDKGVSGLAGPPRLPVASWPQQRDLAFLPLAPPPWVVSVLCGAHELLSSSSAALTAARPPPLRQTPRLPLHSRHRPMCPSHLPSSAAILIQP